MSKKINSRADVLSLRLNISALMILFCLLILIPCVFIKENDEKYTPAFAVVTILGFLFYLYLYFNTFKGIYKDRKYFLKKYYIDNITFFIALANMTISRLMTHTFEVVYHIILLLVAIICLLPTVITYIVIKKRFGR